MSSMSETSFGARLRRLQDATEFIKTWSDYNPPRVNETPDGLETFINNVIALNSAETISKAAYSKAVAERLQLFTGKQQSVKTLLISVRGAVEAQFGKKSAEATQVAALIATVRKNRLVKLTADPAAPGQEKKISQSEQSYGSRTQYFSDIVTTLAEAPGYVSSNTAITLSALQDKVKELHAANNAVAAQLQQMTTERSTRTAYYNDITERFKRMKAYAKSQYGNNSPEYKSLISLN